MDAPCRGCENHGNWRSLADADPSTPKKSEPCSDAIIEKNVALLRERSRFGVAKYGITLAGSKLTKAQYLRHALEEALDLSNYLMGALEAELAEQARIIQVAHHPV